LGLALVVAAAVSHSPLLLLEGIVAVLVGFAHQAFDSRQ
jgi:hypothetical protein